jgi:CBS domain containing-hemolysin-like protein
MRVSEVMQPRITMEALEVNATLADFLQLVDTTKYSRVIMCGHVH